MTLHRLWHRLFGHPDFEWFDWFDSFDHDCRCRCGRYMKDGVIV